MVQTQQECGTSNVFSEINCGPFQPLGGMSLSRFRPPWSVGTHRSGLKGSKQSTLVPFHVKAIQHELRVKAVPVEYSSKGNLIGRLETKLWGHLCLVPPLLVLLQPVLQRQRHREQVNCCVNQELLCDSVYFSGPRTHLTDGSFASHFIPDAKFSFQNLHFNRKKQKVSHNPSRGWHLKLETLSVEWQLRYDILKCSGGWYCWHIWLHIWSVKHPSGYITSCCT